MIVISTAVVLL